jgi:hypothetical protein
MAIPWSAVEFLLAFLSAVLLAFLKLILLTLTSEGAAATLSSRIEGIDTSLSFSYAGEVAGAAGVAGAAAAGLGTGA